MNVLRGARICLCTFDLWQERVQAVISRFIFGQKNLAEISFTVAFGPGRAKWCRVSKKKKHYDELQIQVTIDPKCPDMAGLRPSAVSRYPKVRTEN